MIKIATDSGTVYILSLTITSNNVTDITLHALIIACVGYVTYFNASLLKNIAPKYEKPDGAYFHKSPERIVRLLPNKYNINNEMIVLLNDTHNKKKAPN